jgi:hypothetical protein
MNNIIYFPKSKMIEKAKEIGIQPLPIELFEDNYLYQFGHFVYYGEYQVHPEFYNLMHIPFQLSVSVTFAELTPRLSESESPRRLVVTKLLRRLNRFLAEKHPSLDVGSNGIRATMVIEHSNYPKSREKHAHLLLHFNRKIPDFACAQVLEHLKGISPDILHDIGIATLDAQSLIKGKAKCVSYFCKIEENHEFKKVDYSKGFFPIARRKFLPKKALTLGRAT